MEVDKTFSFLYLFVCLSHTSLSFVIDQKIYCSRSFDRSIQIYTFQIFLKLLVEKLYNLIVFFFRTKVKLFVLFQKRLFLSFTIKSNDRGLLGRISLDQKSLFSVDPKFHFQLIKFFETFHLIERFDQVPKFVGSFLALDQKFINVILSYFKLLINCQNLQVIFWHLIESF